MRNAKLDDDGEEQPFGCSMYTPYPLTNDLFIGLVRPIDLACRPRGSIRLLVPLHRLAWSTPALSSRVLVGNV